MKYLVRGGIILSIAGLFAVFIYAQTKTEKRPSSAKDSQPKLINSQVDSEPIVNNDPVKEETLQDQDQDKDKKFIISPIHLKKIKTIN